MQIVDKHYNNVVAAELYVVDSADVAVVVFYINAVVLVLFVVATVVSDFEIDGGDSVIA